MFADPSGHFFLLLFTLLVTAAATTHAVTKTAQATHEVIAASTEKTIFSEDEQREKNYEKGNVGDLVYYYTKTPDSDTNFTKVQIIDSWKFTKEQALMILNNLKKNDKDCESLNILRVYNEWQWHNVAYTLGYKREQTGSVEFYLNARDDEHNPLIGFIFDFWWLG